MAPWEICRSAGCAVGWLLDWQTLVAGVLAIGAAAVTIYQTGRANADQRLRRHRAARAVLPLTLSGVCGYARASALALNGHLMMVQAVGAAELNHAGPAFSPPPLPPEFIPAIERMIEGARSREVADRLADIIGEIQVLTARMSSDDLMGPDVTEPYLEEQILKCAGLYALANSLLDFARRQRDGPSLVSWSDARSALKLMGFHSVQHDRMFAALEHRIEKRIAVVEEG